MEWSQCSKPDPVPHPKLVFSNLHCKQAPLMIQMQGRIFQLFHQLEMFVGPGALVGLELPVLAWHCRTLGASSWQGPGLGRNEPRKMCVPSGGDPWFRFRGGSLLCLSPSVGFTFWRTPGSFKGVEDHLSCLPSVLAGGLHSSCLSCSQLHPTVLTLSRCLANV